jgi:cytochrome c oxidase subunit 4
MNSVKPYIAVAVALLLLLALTVGVAYVDLGPWNTAVAMLVSLAKGMLILIFFMHLGKASALVRLAACAGFFWLAIMLVLILGDFMTR